MKTRMCASKPRAFWTIIVRLLHFIQSVWSESMNLSESDVNQSSTIVFIVHIICFHQVMNHNWYRVTYQHSNASGMQSIVENSHNNWGKSVQP